MASNDRVIVSVTEMEAAINKYENARSTLQDAFKRLDSAKDHLDRCYEGPAKMALSARWATINANVRSAENAIEESVQGLRNTISTMEDTESDIGSKVAALDVGTTAPVYL